MVVVTGTAAVTISLVSLLVGGGGIWAYFKYFNGENDWPSFSNSSFGFSQWEHKSNNDLIGLNFDFNSGGVIFEIGMILTICFIILLCFSCGCQHLPQPNCMRERKHKRRTARKEKLRRKQEKQREEEEIKAERRRRKEIRRNREHKFKLAKKISSGHWSIRHIDEDRKREILNEVQGGGTTGSDKGSCVLVEEEVGRRPSTVVEEAGRRSSMRSGETGRRSSIMSSSSVWSSTSADGSSWYCGSQIHHRASLCTYNEGEEEGDREGVRSDSVSVTSSDTTTINM